MKQNTIETKGYRIRNVIRLIRSMKPYTGEMWLTVLSVFLKHMSTIGAVIMEGIQGLKDILALNYVEAYEKKISVIWNSSISHKRGLPKESD